MAALALLACLGGAGRAQADPARDVSSGPLRAEVTESPWGLRFVDARGGALEELPGGTPLSSAGSLAFRFGGQWFHATRILRGERDRDAYVASVETTDPLGRELQVRIAPAADGVVRVTATGPPGTEAMSIGFRASATERFLGFGERSNAVDQRGNEVENYVAEGPYQDVEQPALVGFVPAPGYRPRRDATYFPIPWLLSTRGYGVLIEGDETSRFRAGSERADAWSMEIDASQLSFSVFAGPRPADVLRRFTSSVGRQPRAAAPFYFGPWWQPRGSDDANLKTLKDAGAIGSLAQTYTHYLPCGDQQGAEQAQRDRTAKFHAAGLAVTTYFNPMICTTYEPRYSEARDREVLTKNALGQPYEYRYTGSSVFLVGQFDFTAPGATGFYGDLLDEAVGHGYDGWMEDFGEYTPPDSVSADGTPGTRMHNLYPTLYHAAAHRYSRERSPRPLARFNRSGWTGTAREAQIVWGGDPTTSWGFDGLASAVMNGLTMGLSGVSLWGSDIGGFFALSEPQTTPELLRRWIQFGFASGVMRTQANGFALRQTPRAQIFDADVLPVWRRYARLRTQLYPYLAAAEREYDRSGLPIMRHLSLAYPTDALASARADEYLFGPDLLAAPVIEPGATRRRAYLPRGDWIDLWRSVSVRPDVSLELRRPRVLGGGAEVEVPAPQDELPLFVRSGTLLALLPADVETLADYGSGVVRLRDRSSRTLLAWPARGRTGRAEPDAGESATSELQRERWVLRLRAPAQRRYELQAAIASRPCAVTVAGRALPAAAWSYEPASAILRASFELGSGDLVADLSCAGATQRPASTRLARPRTGPRAADTVAAGATGGDDGSLPFTGLTVGLVLAAGALLLGLGVALRRGRDPGRPGAGS